MENQRKLAAIMFTDIVGYTAMMGADENSAITTVTHHQKTIEQTVPKFNGDVIQFYGDGSLSIFTSATSALECAMEIQTEFQKDIAVPLRIGIHIGEILIKEGNVFGDGVNIASRIESLGQSGTIMFSEDVFQKIKNNSRFTSQVLGNFEFENVDKPMQIYALANKGFPVPNPESITGKLKSSSAKPESNLLTDLTKRKIPEKSIAVLPFVNMSSDPEQEFFCEGISEEIINTIVQLPDLVVAGRTSSFCFKGKNEDLRIVGNTLGVSKILEGSVRKSGNRVRITAQLIEAATGFHQWSKKYDRELDDVFKIQDEISTEIANQLKITLAGSKPLPKPRHQTKNIEAYQLYFKGRSLFYKRGMSLFKALKCFRKALQIDPTYALAYAGLADTIVMLSFHGYLAPTECWAEAIPASQKALKYGPDLGETHNALAVIALLYDRDFEKAEREFKKALEINPTHIQSRVWYGMIYLAFTRGKFEEGIEQFRIVAKSDPLSSYVYSCFALTLATGEKFEESIGHAEYAVKEDPNSLIARYNLGYCYLWSDQPEKALEQCLVALKISSRHAWILHLVLLTYLKLNRKNEALKIFKEMEVRYRDFYLPPSNLAIAAAALGKNEYALELLETGLDIVDPYLPFVVTALKDGEALRNIPGFDKIKEGLGFD
jgi:TolB-like protein/class 3 adenylate cyclase/Flp pilus assembly protein TadD